MPRPDKGSPASRSRERRSPVAALSYWLERHAQNFVASLGKLVRQPFASALTIGVIGLGLALPAVLHLVVVNASAIAAGIEDTVQLSVYLTQPLTAEQARKVQQGIDARDDVLEAELVTPEQGLREFEQMSGFGEALRALGDNPLPYAITVRPAPRFDTPEAVATLADELKTLPEVDIVQVDTEWVQRLHAILEALGQVVWLAAILLGVGVLIIIGNTIRLDINGRREEIEVIKLVGGSNAFVRRPFLYTGVWYGLGGGALAWIIVTAAVAFLAGPVERVATLYGSGIRLQGLDTEAAGVLLAGGTVLGWLGAWAAAQYHLRRIEPRA
jgi:cell division transport system permease protein